MSETQKESASSSPLDKMKPETVKSCCYGLLLLLILVIALWAGLYMMDYIEWKGPSMNSVMGTSTA